MYSCILRHPVELKANGSDRLVRIPPRRLAASLNTPLSPSPSTIVVVVVVVVVVVALVVAVVLLSSPLFTKADFYCRRTNRFCLVVFPPPLFHSTHTLLLQASSATTATLEAAIHIYSFTTAVLQPANASPQYPQYPPGSFPKKPTHEPWSYAYPMAST